MSTPNKEFYEEALDKFQERHYKGCGAYEEYILFSKFVYGVFIRNKNVQITSGNFRDVNVELMKKIARKIEKHPKIFKRFFMID